MSGPFVIQWMGLDGAVLPVSEAMPAMPGQRLEEFATEADALVALVDRCDGLIQEARSTRRTAAARLRQLRRRS